MIMSIKRMRDSEDGVTAIEYALLGTLIAVAIVVTIAMVGSSVGLLYADLAVKIALATQ
jgi:pilus assembly protein Flp/PilA